MLLFNFYFKSYKTTGLISPSLFLIIFNYTYNHFKNQLIIIYIIVKYAKTGKFFYFYKFMQKICALKLYKSTKIRQIFTPFSFLQVVNRLQN